MIEELNEYLEKLVSDEVFPGCNYCIIANKETYLGSIGYKSLIPQKEKNDLSNMYDIASLTKVLVTNVLMSFLLADHKIKLDDLVCQYIEDFPYDDVKIIHLLTHSSGIKVLYDKNNLKTKDEFIHKIDRAFMPGTNAQYVDINYILLGFIIEKIYQKSIDIVAREKIFEPLKMTDTCFNPHDRLRCVPNELKEQGLVVGYVHDEKAAFLNGIAGHAGVFSTVEDLSHFLMMVLQDGKYDSKQFVNLSYIDTWFTPLFIDDKLIRRTIGWVYGPSSPICSHVCSSDTIVHTGFPGHIAIIDRGNDVAILLLSNRIHPDRHNDKLLTKRQTICEEIYRLLKKYNKIY